MFQLNNDYKNIPKNASHHTIFDSTHCPDLVLLSLSFCPPPPPSPPPPKNYRSLQDIIAILGMDELSEARGSHYHIRIQPPVTVKFPL